MSATMRVNKIKQAETDIAVLQVQVRNLDEKFDELKVDFKDLRGAIDKGSEDTLTLIKELQTSNSDAHQKLTDKINVLERMRWMLLGAAAVGGAMGFETLQMVVTNFVS